jgi:hypothetical protein
MLMSFEWGQHGTLIDSRSSRFQCAGASGRLDAGVLANSGFTPNYLRQRAHSDSLWLSLSSQQIHYLTSQYVPWVGDPSAGVLAGPGSRTTVSAL